MATDSGNYRGEFVSEDEAKLNGYWMDVPGGIPEDRRRQPARAFFLAMKSKLASHDKSAAPTPVTVASAIAIAPNVAGWTKKSTVAVMTPSNNEMNHCLRSPAARIVVPAIAPAMSPVCEAMTQCARLSARKFPWTIVIRHAQPASVTFSTYGAIFDLMSFFTLLRLLSWMQA